MAIKPDFTVGTLTLTSGNVNFTTTGSALQSADVQGGDEIITQSGATLIIATITGQNGGTLMLPCPAGAAGAGQALRVRFQPEGSRLQGAIRDLLITLTSGNLETLAALVGANGKVPMFTAPGVLALVDRTALGIADANGNLAALGALALASNKFLTTGADKKLRQSDITTAALATLALSGASNKLVYFNGADTAALTDLTAAARALLNLAGTASANKLAYFDGANSAALADITAAARALLNLAGTAAANKFAYFDAANSTALADITAAARSLLGNANMPGTLSGFRNKIINGDFSINQRNGTRTPGVNVYGFDMWKGHANGLQQICEALPAGQYTLTWSGGGNGTFAGTTKASPIVGTIAAGDTTVVVPSAATGVSLVPGDASGEVNPFSARHIQQELALCQRYYEFGIVAAYDPVTRANNALVREFSIPFFVQKRVNPTMKLSYPYTNGSKLRDDLLTGQLRSAVGYLTTGTTTNVDLNISWTADASL